MTNSKFRQLPRAAVALLFAAALCCTSQTLADDEQGPVPKVQPPANQPPSVFGGRGGGGFAGGHASMNVLPAAEFAVVISENKDRVAVYNSLMGAWHFQEMANAVSPETALIPLIAQNLVFVWGDGNYYAYSVMQGKWQAAPAKQKLKRRLDGPIVSANMASLVLDDHVYAFSAFTGTWEKLEIPIAEGNRVAHAGNYIHVTHGDVISAFSAQTGKWSSINFKLAKPVNWKVEPKPE